MAKPQLTTAELERWAQRATAHSTPTRLGVPEAVVELTAAPRIVDYVRWYTAGYFEELTVTAKARLCVTSMPVETWRSVFRGQVVPPLRRVSLPSEHPKMVCLVDDQHDSVHLILPTNASHDTKCQLTARIVRALVLRHLLVREHPFFHAALFVVHGVGVALMGSRQAGKTTTLLHALNHAKAALVGNDKFAMLPSTDFAHQIVVGFPVKVGIRAGSINALAEGPLRAFLAQQWDREFGDIEHDQDSRLQIRPQKLAAVSGNAVLPRCRLGAVIQPHLDRRATAPRLQRLNKDEREMLWTSNLLDTPESVFPQQAALANSGVRADCRTAKVPTYRLIQPPASGAAASKLLDNLARHLALEGSG